MNPPSRLRAPQDDGAVLAVPPFGELDSLIARNRRLLNERGPDFLGRAWSDLRAEARREALRAAQQYFTDNGEPVPSASVESLVLAGHQPELFHPGVWIKNFALQSIARRCGATPLALIVDNDTVKSTALRLPSPELGRSTWHRAQVPFDFHGVDVPYEERKVADERTFSSLPERAAEIVSKWGFTPFLSQFWKEVLEHQKRTPLLGERFVAARRSFERRWGCHNLELGVSRLCSTQAFAWFAGHILCNIEEFHATYNRVVQEYRLAHRIRSRNHPVPDLARENDWLESPFWAWRTGDRRRRRLFVLSKDWRTQLRLGRETWDLSRSSPHESLRQIADAGVKIRPRALTTTLYARLMLADLFVHGIGGAKYDALTDELLKRFYRIQPPAYVIVSGTLLLPLPALPTSGNGSLKRRLRDMWYNPQRHLPASLDSHTHALADEKQSWIDRACLSAQDRKNRFEKLRELSAALRPALAGLRSEVSNQAAECHDLIQSQAVLNRRDYAFCLFPEDKLASFCRRFLE